MGSVRAAKQMVAFLVVAGGLLAMVAVMGGGSLGAGGANTDPRTIGVEVVLLEYADTGDGDVASRLGAVLPGEMMVDDDGFRAFRDGVSELAASAGAGSVRLRTPTLLVQHREDGSIETTGAAGSFSVSVAARVVDDGMLRVVLVLESDRDGESLAHRMTFTSDGSAGFVSDQSEVFGEAGGGLVLAVRPRLVVDGR